MTKLDTAKANLKASLLSSGKTEEEANLTVDAFICVRSMPSYISGLVQKALCERDGIDEVSEEMKTKFNQDLNN